MGIDGRISRGYSREIGERNGERGRILGRFKGNMSRARREMGSEIRRQSQTTRKRGKGTEMRGTKGQEDGDAKESGLVAERDYRNIEDREENGR